MCTIEGKSKQKEDKKMKINRKLNEYKKLPCRTCGKVVARPPNYAKRTVRHKCPHGEWCTQAHQLTGLHQNKPAIGACPECRKEYFRKLKEGTFWV